MPRQLVRDERVALDEILDGIEQRMVDLRPELDKLLGEIDQRLIDARRQVERGHTGWIGSAYVEIDHARSTLDDIFALGKRVQTVVGEVATEVRYLDRYLYRLVKSMTVTGKRDRKGRGIAPPQRRG